MFEYPLLFNPLLMTSHSSVACQEIKVCVLQAQGWLRTHALQSTVYAAVPPSVCRLLSQALNPLGHYTDPFPFILPVLHPDIVCTWGSVVEMNIPVVGFTHECVCLVHASCQGASANQHS